MRLRPVGDGAVTFELGTGIDPALAARVRALQRRLDDEPFAGYAESLPTYRSLLVLYDPRAATSTDIARHLERLARGHEETPARGALHEIPTVYGGEHGPDLAEVAARCGRTAAEVVALHASREYDALMLGFMPGFAYLGPLPPELELPRRATPRALVPAGTVAIAGRQTAVYPSASPAGWHLVGRTSLALFDPQADAPARIQAGDRVRFVPVREWDDTPPSSRPPSAGTALEVLDGGLLTSVQAAPRRGYRRFGVASSGPLDLAAHVCANQVLGNAADAATLECTLMGPTLRFLTPLRFAICGADLGATLERSDLGAWPVPLGVAVLARPGNVLRFAEPRRGCRAYAAFAGGLDVPLVLGSRATDVKAGFGGWGGRALRAGDRLGVLPAQAGEPRDGAPHALRADEDELQLRVVLGPQDDLFAPEAIARFLGSAYTLSSECDRFGARLDGPSIAPLAGEIVSDGLVPGCVQVPPDGRPIVTLAEGPTTGGYPKIATIVAAELSLLAQRVPGRGRVRFVRAQCSTS